MAPVAVVVDKGQPVAEDIPQHVVVDIRQAVVVDIRQADVVDIRQAAVVDVRQGNFEHYGRQHFDLKIEIMSFFIQQFMNNCLYSFSQGTQIKAIDRSTQTA